MVRLCRFCRSAFFQIFGKKCVLVQCRSHRCALIVSNCTELHTLEICRSVPFRFAVVIVFGPLLTDVLVGPISSKSIHLQNQASWICKMLHRIDNLEHVR